LSWAIWITGPPASGKSAIALAAAARLRRTGEPVHTLELDWLRRTLTPQPTYSDAERELVYRTLVYLARLLAGSGIPVLIDATAHRRRWRDLARSSIDHFAEVQLVCPLPVLRERERTRTGSHAPRGIYAAADRPGATVPGVNVPYEEALAPELRLDTAAVDVDTAAGRVAALGLELARRARRLATDSARAPEAWAAWITGLPGSGKTTLAGMVAEALAARGVRVHRLDFRDLADFVLDGRHPSPAEDEALHRALVCAARVLTEAGIGVLIDATAPRRAWRELARRAIARFAEIQLHCPPEVCVTRERATRWSLVACAGAAPGVRRDAAPDIVLCYEYALDPELIIHTDAQSAATAAEDVLRLVERLHRDALAHRP
jgi:adenylylsulfate kinase